jgi:serine/threonine-protein kinase RsbW
MVLAADQKIRISSKAENIILVERMIEDVCDLFNINQDYYGNILVALTEAVNNAIYHGNQANATKSIDISFKTTPDCISFIIKDEGPGFGYDNLPDPTNPENIEKPNGRGVFLMRNLADKVSFEDNGSKVILDFKVNTNTAA